MTTRVLPAMTCLGCGCTCDDIVLTVSEERIVGAERACDPGARWFGDGSAPAVARVDGADVTLADALGEAARRLRDARRPRVVLAPDLSTEAYGEGVACADLLGARLDAVPRSTSMLAMQERGIATATLGEIRNRADLLVYWGVNPDHEFPRFKERYTPACRTIVVDPDNDIDTLVAAVALLNGVKGSVPAGWSSASSLVDHFNGARYVAVIADGRAVGGESPARLRWLLALGQALNVSGRGMLCLLRDGGNRAGAESVMTRQTGYPDAIDFSTGVPQFQPHAPGDARADDVTLWLGASRQRIDETTSQVANTIVIGPASSDGAFSAAGIVIDTGTPGIHSAGTVVRMDDVALPARAAVAGPPDAGAVIGTLAKHLSGLRR